jgi:uncharacterized protein (DUF1330 family)
MRTVNPGRAHIEDFARKAPDAAPIVMLNLLKFRDFAEYEEIATARVTGRKAYERYSRAVVPLLWEVGGQILWMGKARAGVIILDDESWDEVVLVHYPSRGAFVRMITSDAYQAIMRHRTAALADSRLIETRAVRLPRIVLAAARGATRAKALFRATIPR